MVVGQTFLFSNENVINFVFQIRSTYVLTIEMTASIYVLKYYEMKSSVFM